MCIWTDTSLPGTATLFDRLVVRALEESPSGKLTVSELRRESKISRGITDIVSGLKARGLVMFDGTIAMDTVVSLSGR